MTSNSVLVVEDDPIVAEDVRQMVQRNGTHVVGIAGSAALALEIAERAAPTLALVDIRLVGERDGIAVAQELRRLGVGVLYLTAHSDRGTLMRAMETEPVGFLTKPFSEAELLRGISIGQRLVAVRRREQQERHQLLDVLANVEDGIALFDVHGALRFSNSALQKLVPFETPERLAEMAQRLLTREAPPPFAPDIDAVSLQLGELKHTALIVRRRAQSEPKSECLTMCSYCRRVRADDNSWKAIETVLVLRFGLLVSHGLCGDCLSRYYDFDVDSDTSSVPKRSR